MTAGPLLARTRAHDRELDDEIRAHHELAERDGIAGGLSPEEARRAAAVQPATVLRDEG